MSTPQRARTAATSLVASSEWPPRSKNESSAPTAVAAEQLGEQVGDAPLGVGGGFAVFGAGPTISGSGSAFRSILPCAVIGISSITTYAAGIMYSGSAAATRARMRSIVDVLGRHSAGVRYATRLLPRFGQLADHHDGLPHAGVDGDGGGDFAEFDPEAADLDLLVGAADELDVAVGVAAGQVTGPVQPARRV